MTTTAAVAARREKVALLVAEGRRNREIAEICGVGLREINRDKYLLGLSDPVHGLARARALRARPWTDATVQLAHDLLVDECPLKEIARTLGCTPGTIARRFPDLARAVSRPGHNPIAGMGPVARQLGLELR